MIKKEIKQIIIFTIKSLIIWIIIFIWLSFWWNQKIYDFLFIISPTSDNYFTKFVNNNNFYCEWNKLVLLDNIFKYWINNKYETGLENIKDYWNKNVYSLKSNYKLESINQIHRFVFDNKLYCEWDKLFLWRVPWVLEWFYCWEKEWIEINQEKPVNECY